IKTTSA
ncbi:hypothetical protein D043_3898B, partial [Vibrio parahaemolyticus EKP-021]